MVTNLCDRRIRIHEGKTGDCISVICICNLFPS